MVRLALFCRNSDEAMLKEKAAQVEEKVKSKQKLTTEDLLAFQSQKD